MSTAADTSTALLAQLANGERSSVELTRECLEQIDTHDQRIGAFLHVDAEAALLTAADVDRRRTSGQPVGRLGGLPVAIKDVLTTRDQPTTCASRMLETFRPPYDAHVITQLRAADAVLIGKTNMDEFAMGSTTENSAFGPTRTPWHPECVAGGSSGGSAAAVAAGMAPLALGSDTGGSIRQPASFCGVVGVKPTYGRVSRYGLIAYASSLDQVGPFARDVAGAALLLEVLSGHDPRDATCLDQDVPGFLEDLQQPLDGLSIGIAADHFAEGLDGEVRDTIETALDVYRRLGAQVREISLPHARFAVACYYLVASSEASSNLARYDGVHYGYRCNEFEDLVDMYSRSRGEALGTEVKRRIMLGTYALSVGYYDAYYLKALKVRRLIREDFDRAFGDVDLIVSPVSPTPAVRLGELTADPLQMYLADTYTIGANLAGLPGLSIPAGFSEDGRPIGLQLLAPACEESRLLRAAAMFERATDWHAARPTLERPDLGADT